MLRAEKLITSTLEVCMRVFTDAEGRSWTADTRAEDSTDYKGRYHLVLQGEGDIQVELTDVSWNSERTARRTIKSMSLVELRRRLRSATGRGVVSD